MNRLACTFACLLAVDTFANSQQTSLPPVVTPPTTADQARVFVTDSNSWEQHGSAAGSSSSGSGGFFASSSGGARPQTAEVIKTFGQRCPQVLVNNRPSMVDYVVELDHEGGKGLLTHKNKIAVFVRTSGDGLFSKSTLSLGGSVQDACAAILAHWTAHSIELKAAAVAAAVPPAPALPIIVQTTSSPAIVQGVSVDATIANCEINVDGDFVGNTPSVVVLAPGKHLVLVKKTGYQDWSRSMMFSGGSVKLSAEMVAR